MAPTDVLTANGDVGAQRVRDEISRALYAKREQLDREVEDYKAQKDREYKDFEDQLRRRDATAAQSSTKQITSPGKQVGELSEDERRPAHQQSESKEQSSKLRQYTARKALNQVFGSGFEEGREWEGVFTPEYLGLIDANKHADNGSLQPITAAADGSQQLSSPATLHPPLVYPWASSPVDVRPVSSSATLHPPLVYPWASSPVDARPVSSSAPEHSPPAIHHRSDSANSTLSVSSLRSSMKDPKAPKSPKRVLFSIGDGVVSPSTSPKFSRKGNESAIGEGDAVDSILTFAKRGREKKKKTRRKERGDGERGRRGREDLENIGISEDRGFTNAPEGWTKSKPITSGRPSLPNGINSNGTTVRPAMTEDYEKVEKGDDDDMFAFDEDLDLRSTSTRDEAIEDLDDEGDGAATKPLTETGTSPHAGSLPIEIKWPRRRDSGGVG